MGKMYIKEIVEATQGTLISGNPNSKIIDIVTDSRLIEKDIFFIPLIGEKFDGHEFIESAFEKGALGCITQRDLAIRDENKCMIKVNDTLKALQDIARYYRNKFPIPFIGITGSVGKTTTKDMVACVLEQKYSVLKTKGNFNNEIGLPLTVFGLDKTHNIGITEMGMSGFGEISRLTSIVRPDTAIITNIGLSHIEKLGSQENILKAKAEIFDTFDQNNLAILNGDDPLLYGLKEQITFRKVYFGIHNTDCELSVKEVLYQGEEGSRFSIRINGNDYVVSIPVMGEHNIYNALAAIAVGLEYNVGVQDIIKGIASFRPGKMRLDIFETNGIKVIDDCYNASPASMEAAIKILAQCSTKGRKIAILGDMLEMGGWALDAHKKVGCVVVNNKIDYLIAVGSQGKNIASGALEAGMEPRNVKCFASNEAIIDFLNSFIKPNDVVLIKASRGMKMEQISDFLRQGGK